MKALREIFSDDYEHFSFMRVMSGFVTFMLTVTWCQHVIRSGAWTPLDAGTVTAILGLAVAKVWQKAGERPNGEAQEK
jgi:hypothetical protein